VFVIGTSAPVFETATPTLNSFNETTGEINATVSVENIGSTPGVYESTLTAGGTSLTTVEREIAAGETVEISVSGVVESAGPVTLRFAGASLGDVTRSETVDEKSASTSGWPLVLAGILVTLVALAVVWRRRTTDDNL